MGVSILLIVLGLLIWIGCTWERYVDPGVPDTPRMSDTPEMPDAPGEAAQRARAHHARQHAIHLAEAEFWTHRATEATHPGHRALAANIAAHHRNRVHEFEL